MIKEKLKLRIILWIISLMIFSFVIIDVSGQNWIPFNPRNTSNYSTSDLFQDFSVIKTDSFKVVNSDTVFYLNTVLANYTIAPYNYPIVLPQFLMKTLKNTDNEWHVFKDTSTYVFKIRAPLGDSWIFDSTHNIIATVSKIKYDTIFGQQDSLKYIILSSADTIIISKNYGIISMDIPNSKLKYRLLGIENLKLGYRVPQYLDFFSFNVGDVFEYTERYEHNGWSVASRAFSQVLYQIKILQKTQLIDGCKYYIEKSEIDSSWSYGSPMEITYEKTSNNIEYNYDSSSFLNYYNNQKFTNYGVQRLYFSYDTFYHVNVKKYDVVLLPDQESASYGVGIGLIDYYYYQYNNAGGDDRIYKSLTGCKIGDHLFGTIHQDWFFTEIENTSNEVEMNVFPNPAVDFLLIRSNLPISPFSYSILDMTGKFILSGIIANDENSIDITKLSKAQYIIKILAKEKIWIKSFIKL
jgi:hypothetical protein